MNYLFINTDQQRWDTLGCYGSVGACTPNLERVNAPSTPAVRCLVTDDWKFVHYEGKDFGELYERRNDPNELRNLWAEPGRQNVVCDMRDRLLGFLLESEPVPKKTDIF